MTVTITPTVESGNVPPRVRLDIAAGTETATTVLRLDPDGNLVPVRTDDGNPLPISGGTALLYDYEAPFDGPVFYTSVESSTTFSDPVVVPASQVWLIHPGVPSLSLPVRLAQGTFSKRTRTVQQGVFTPIGRARPIVVTDGARKSVQSQLSVLTTSVAEAEAIDDLASDAGVLLLNIPTSLNYNFSTCYVALGDMESGPVIEKVFELWQTFTWPFTVVDRPAGGSQAERTLADLLDYSTLGALRTAYPTLLDLLAGP